MRRHSKKNYRIMPWGLQIHMIEKLFRKLNPELEFEEYIELDLLDNLGTYRDNLEIMKRNYSQFIWESPKEEIMLKETVEHDIEQKGKFTIHSYEVRIKKHKVKSKGKLYHCGRIQLTVDKHLIGHKARITVIVPNVVSSV